MSGAQLLVQPSHFESFSLVLAEAWAQGVPAVVQARSEVLAGQARRARGAISYHGYAEFEAALDLLLPDAELRRRLGENGRAYVRDRYDWDRVLARFEGLLERILRPGRELPAGRMGDKAS